MSQQPYAPAYSMTDSLQRSWRSIIANVWLFAGFTLLYYVAISVASRIPFIGSFTSLFSFILTVSTFSALHVVASGRRELGFNDFFSWTPKFGKLLIGNLVLLLAAVVVFLPVIILILVTLGGSILRMFSTGDTDVFREGISAFFIAIILIAALLTLVLLLLLLVATFSYYFLILFKDLPPIDALKLSWQTGRRNIGPIILFALLAIGISLLGMLALVIGLLVAIPVVLGMQYYYLCGLFPDDRGGQWDFMQEQDVPRLQ